MSSNILSFILAMMDLIHWVVVLLIVQWSNFVGRNYGGGFTPNEKHPS